MINHYNMLSVCWLCEEVLGVEGHLEVGPRLPGMATADREEILLPAPLLVSGQSESKLLGL